MTQECLQAGNARLDFGDPVSCALFGDFGAKPRFKLDHLLGREATVCRSGAAFPAKQRTQMGALATDERGRASDQLLHLVLRSTAE
jgi:hypothetical protein